MTAAPDPVRVSPVFSVGYPRATALFGADRVGNVNMRNRSITRLPDSL